MNITKKTINRNYSSREGQGVRAIVIHIAEGSLAGAYNWFGFYEPNPKVSAHYMIGKNGEIWQFLSESVCSWHAGGVNQPSRLFATNHNVNLNPNTYTIGIEHEGFTGQKFTREMLTSLQDLVYDIAKRYGWERLEYGVNILGHNEINSVSRAHCPGVGIHLTNDLILPVNKRLMSNVSERDQQLFDLLMLHREDDANFAAAGITAENVYDKWAIEWSGWLEITWALGKNGVKLPAEKTPDSIIDTYIRVSPNLDFKF